MAPAKAAPSRDGGHQRLPRQARAVTSPVPRRYTLLDSPASSTLTQQRFGWKPEHPGLIADLDEGHYFTVT